MLDIADKVKARQEYKRVFVIGMGNVDTSVNWIEQKAVEFANKMIEDDLAYEDELFEKEKQALR